ncbi:MAG TPA: hypothetical protein VGZ22_07805 [Isosphaeraceae bacterium]|nr:hypothetical protein [Isosphaeraceae bacterium]
MRLRSLAAVIATVAWLGVPSAAWAGMPAITLSELARMRVQTISFFLACFLLSAWIIQWIWNSLRRDFPRLPRLSYGKATGLIALWGLLFLLVLTMIAGARELMTPGAWKKEGLTYKLAGEPPTVAEASQEAKRTSRQDSERRQALDRLRMALWTYARSHGGQFPADRNAPEIPDDAWRVPDPSGMRYIYRPGLVADCGELPLAFEPGISGNDRLVLLTSGKIRQMTPDEIRLAAPEGAR